MNLFYGTANFQEGYGALKSKISLHQITEILDFLKKKKIFNLDTAITYKRTESNDLINYKKFKIFSKLKKIPRTIKNKRDLKIFIYNEISKELKKYKIKKLYGYYIHNINDLNKHGKNLNLIFNELKKEQKIKFCGLSFYDIEIEFKYLSVFKPDIIQLPFNFLTYNKNIILKLKKIRKQKIKILARSIFLQGLILKKSQYLPSKLSEFRKALFEIEQHGYSSIEKKILLTINVIKQSKVFDGIIFSCNNLTELKNFSRLFKKKTYYDLNFLEKIKIGFKSIDPRKW